MDHFQSGLKALVCISAGLLAAIPAWAGSKIDAPVLVDTVGRFAGGFLGSVRNTSDSVQYVECDVWTALGICFATNASGVSASCSTTDPNMVADIRALNGDSSVTFYWNASGLCTQIVISNGSSLAPKAP